MLGWQHECCPHCEKQPTTEHAGLKESTLLAKGSYASYLHAIYCIFHCEIVKDLEQDLHHILSPVEIIVV